MRVGRPARHAGLRLQTTSSPPRPRASQAAPASRPSPLLRPVFNTRHSSPLFSGLAPVQASIQSGWTHDPVLAVAAFSDASGLQYLSNTIAATQCPCRPQSEIDDMHQNPAATVVRSPTGGTAHPPGLHPASATEPGAALASGGEPNNWPLRHLPPGRTLH